MHKSIILLLGLLTFLMPINTSSMSNSNALAFEDYDYGYEADQYERYAMDMVANDNYYNSQGSDLIKKIKCNNINSNFNGVEANIGTVDPLGIGAAESIQDDASASAYGYGERYNNGNFDFDCINNNNNTGEGERGPVGPRGPAGPVGPSIADMTMYSLTNSVSPEDEFESIDILCDDGDIAFNGGSGLILQSGSLIENYISRPIFDPIAEADVGWHVGLEMETGSTTNLLTGYVTCLDNPPEHIP